MKSGSPGAADAFMGLSKLFSHRHLLHAAAIHCIIWGSFIILAPTQSASVYGYSAPLTDAFLWQGSGLMILLLGIGYGIAASDPVQHWAVVLIGLIAKITGPFGMAWCVWTGQVSPRVLLLIPVNDLIWWYPMALIVYRGISEQSQRKRPLSAN